MITHMAHTKFGLAETCCKLSEKVDSMTGSCMPSPETWYHIVLVHAAQFLDGTGIHPQLPPNMRQSNSQTHAAGSAVHMSARRAALAKAAWIRACMAKQPW